MRGVRRAMGNVLRVFKRDVLRLLKAPCALVVVIALLVLPSVYTWYNVVGFWNPCLLYTSGTPTTTRATCACAW